MEGERVVQHWSPMSQLQRSPEPGVWYVRQLIGYFPEDAMRLAVEFTWWEYIKHTGPSTSNRR